MKAIILGVAVLVSGLAYADYYVKVSETEGEITHEPIIIKEVISLDELTLKIDRLNIAIDNLQSELSAKENELIELELDYQELKGLGLKTQAEITNSEINP
jgi:hypothetical protein